MSTSGEQSAKAGETVLVVEDEVLLRLSIAAYLRDCGYQVIEAADAEEAMLVLKQPDLDIDVLLTDIEMPGAMDGFGLAQWTRANRPGLDVILAGTAPRAVNAAANLCEDGPTRSRTSRNWCSTAFAGSRRHGRRSGRRPLRKRNSGGGVPAAEPYIPLVKHAKLA
jgi:CheY-like chemotaxis protein